MKKHTIRIVGGQYRRTPIPVIEAAGLRPTPDRVRETLYNWLYHLWNGDFSQKCVLDLFAGTGALGFEAASRGACHVHLVENNGTALAALHSLQARLHADQIHIERGDAQTVIRRLKPRSFDLILLDPPFGQGRLAPLWTPLADLLTPAGLLYIESGEKITPPQEFQIIRHGRAGQVHYHLLRFAALHENDQ
jgi:16S rRNA (guanine966-N2)-methyltransferase